MRWSSLLDFNLLIYDFYIVFAVAIFFNSCENDIKLSILATDGGKWMGI
jgi:hypothetical protein